MSDDYTERSFKMLTEKYVQLWHRKVELMDT